MKTPKRCLWPSDDPLMIDYHDKEWGVPLHDDKKLFEFLVLDAFQAGLSWAIVLKKRKGFRKAFHNFNPAKIAKYTKKDVQRLLKDAYIIRNRAKTEATITNAQKFFEVKKEFGSFDRYVWSFVNHKTIKNRITKMSDYPATSNESDKMSSDMKKRGFKFCGSTICYAFMQAAGMVNDHMVGCFRCKELTKQIRLKFLTIYQILV